MAVTSKFELCAVQIGTTVIGQITSEDLSTNVERILATDSATVYHRAAGAEFETQKVSFTTEMMKTALAAVPLLGKIIDGTSNFTAYYKRIDHGANIAAAGCIKLVYAAGMVFLRSISAGKRGLSTGSFEFIAASSDGTTAPYVLSTAQAMPTVVGTEMYVCGGSGVEQWSVDTGITELVEGDAAADFPTLVALSKCLPTVKCTKFDATGGPVITGTLGSVQLQDITAGGRRGTSPITLTFNEEFTPVSSINGMIEFDGTLLYDGTNAPIVFTGLT